MLAPPLVRRAAVSYVEKVLGEGEMLRHSGKVSLWMLSPWIAAGFLLLPVFGLGLILLLVAWVKYISTELAITSKRVIAKFGFIRRSTIEINLAKIETVQVDQSLAGRIFDFGTILLAGGGNPQAPIRGISNPLDFRRAFLDAQELALQARAEPALD
jgi:uncharacterized membrane protein YdbT with pleckstrin-like domain